MTTTANIPTKATAVNNTWGRRCDKLLFVNTESAPGLEVIEIDAEPGRKHLTQKTVKTLKKLYKEYVNEYDWFLKADDDVYIVMDNLRYLLSFYDSRKPVYLGYHFRLGTRQGYMSGGAGFLLSRAALKTLNEEGFNVENGCASDGKDEDLDVGKCLDKLGVKPFSTVDKFGRQSFHAFGIVPALTSDYRGGEIFYAPRPLQGVSCV